MLESERAQLGDLIEGAVQELAIVDVRDTSAALSAAWNGFCVAGCAGTVLSICADPLEYPQLWRNARPVLTTAIGTLREAPSLPAGLATEIVPAGGPDERINDETANTIRQGILALALALNMTLPDAAEHATVPADQRACRDATTLSSELGDCYEGRLRSFLNPYRTSFGPGSFIIRNPGGGRQHRRKPRLRR